MPNGFDKLKSNEPHNNSRIVIEGVDEPARDGKYSDRIKFDPYSPNYAMRPRKPAPLKRV